MTKNSYLAWKERNLSDNLTKPIENSVAKSLNIPSLEGMKPVEKIKILFDTQLTDIKRNSITGEWELNGKCLTEEDMNSFLLDFQGKTTGISENLFYRFLKSNNIEYYNPITDFFELSKNKKLSTGHIRVLAQSINTDTGINSPIEPIDFVELFLTKWLVGAVIQIFDKGVNPLMLVLAGAKQNTGKTTFFRNLLPPSLKPYMAEPKGLSDMKDADLGMLLCENFIVFDDEMAGKSWKDWQRMKSMLSMENFTMRRPYDKRQRKYPRIASLCATNNQLDLLGDPSGNRRLVPIHVVSINHNLYNGVDKDQLWFEAYNLMIGGYNHNLSQDDINILNLGTKDFEVVDEVTELIQEYFTEPAESTIGRLTATNVKEAISRRSSFKSISVNKIGERLRKMGYEQKRDNKTGSRTWIIELKPNYN